MKEMDALEQMAFDLESAQQKRYRKANRRFKVSDEEKFWDVNEMTIFRTIRTFREQSRTFHPDNLR